MRMRCTLMSLALMASLPALAQDEGWPKEFEAGSYTITVYQPQVDAFVDDEIQSRAAVSVKEGGGAPVFGAVWITARVAVDRDTRNVDIVDIKVPTVRFPEASEEQQRQLAALLEVELPTWDIEISLDRLLTSLDAVGVDPPSAVLNNDPPKIIFTSVPAVLVLIDGEPILEQVEGSTLQRVVNTPYLIVHDAESRAYYLASDEAWFSARQVEGPWRPEPTPPQEVAAIEVPSAEQASSDGVEVDPRTPEIVVSKEPAELIFIDGDPTYTPIQDTDLLCVSNTDSDVIRDIGQQQVYVLLSGRWYASSSLDGPWRHVPNDELPSTFQSIPSDSENGHLRASVAGTDEAREAVLDAEIPQTAAVKRDATTTVEYDGAPKFEDVENTGLQTAVNTEKQVIKFKETYYCCDDAVWYQSSSPTGPWQVCTDVPKEIYDIPPSNPNYNVTYVHVYETTPEVVYVGYTPGYVNSFYYGGCMVYGTGWYYRPWYAHYYYPRPATWGFHVRWNPWYGWSFGLSYSNGPFRLTIGSGGHGGWWGPAWYRPYPPYAYRAGYRAGYHHGYWHGYHAGSTRPTPYGRGGANISTGDITINNNIYKRGDNADRVARTRDKADRARPKTAEGAQNNVFTDRNGDVYRRNGDGTWDRRDKGGWSRTETPGAATREARPAQPSAGTRDRPPASGGNLGTVGTGGGSRPSTGPSTLPSTRPQSRPATGQRPSAGSLERDFSSRQRGTARTQSYNRSRAGAAPPMGGGAARRGGGRR